MQLGLVLLVSLLALLVIAACSALRVEFDARGQGLPDGSWVMAGAIALGPLTFSLLRSPGAPLRVDFHLLGRRWPVLRKKPQPDPKPSQPKEPAATPAKSRFRSLGLGPLELVELALNEGRYFGWERLLLDVAYGFRDVALTGRVAGALYALSGALPAKFVIVQRPIWAANERWDARVEGSLRLWPGLVLFSVLWYMLRRQASRLGRSRRAPTGLATSAQISS